MKIQINLSHYNLYECAIKFNWLVTCHLHPGDSIKCVVAAIEMLHQWTAFEMTKFSLLFFIGSLAIRRIFPIHCMYVLAEVIILIAIGVALFVRHCVKLIPSPKLSASSNQINRRHICTVIGFLIFVLTFTGWIFVRNVGVHSWCLICCNYSNHAISVLCIVCKRANIQT